MKNIQTTFTCSSKELTEGYNWAKNMALSYAHYEGSKAGLWYEAALPGRNAFCLRDTVHQSMGAAILGLKAHTKNMLKKFAENIAESRDYCTYWEITGDDQPALEDYINDTDFWYNLPANFDFIRGCYEQYLWTGDTEYINSPIFNIFYKLTFEKYLPLWDKDNDDIPEHYPEYGRRGLASYNESSFSPFLGGDLIGALYAAYESYSCILKLQGNDKESSEYKKRAEDLAHYYLNNWFDSQNNNFYGMMQPDKSFSEGYYHIATFFPVYTGMLDRSPKRLHTLEEVMKNLDTNVEELSYLPEIFYRQQKFDLGFNLLKKLLDPTLNRREYPEVSFTVIGNLLHHMMGISGDGKNTVITCPNLAELKDASVHGLSILGRCIDVTESTDCITLTNHSDSTLTWIPEFWGEHEFLYCNGVPMNSIITKTHTGALKAAVCKEVMPGQSITVSLNC